MLIGDLMRKIGSEPLPPVLLFAPGKAPYGKEPFEPMLADKAIDKIIAQTVDPSMRDLAYAAYYADETQPAEIVLEANTLPFLVEQRVMLVRNADRYMGMGGEKNSPLAPLLHYLESPNPATLLMLVCPKADRRKKLYKACEDAGAIVECPQLDNNELSKWIAHEAEMRGKHIQRAAIHELIERVGSRLSDTNNALDLVCNYVGGRHEISEEDVRVACSDVAEETAFTLTDAIAESDTAKALGTLHQLLALGKSPDEILGLINWLLESAYKAAPESRQQLQSKFVAQKVTPLVKKWGFAKLCRALPMCTDTHFMIRTTGVDELLALELLVIKLSAGSRPARG